MDIAKPGTEELPSTSTIPAEDTVPGTYELLDTIVLALPAEDVPRAATKVDKAWHSVVVSSVAVTKHLLASRFLPQKTTQGHLQDKSITHLNFFWGDVMIKQHGGKELIHVRDKSNYNAFQPQFLSGQEDVPNLSDNDRARLNQGWTKAFELHKDDPDREDLVHLNELRFRFEFALYTYIDPPYAELVRDLRKMWDETLPSGLRSSRAFRDHTTDVLRMLWKWRDGRGKEGWDELVRGWIRNELF